MSEKKEKEEVQSGVMIRNMNLEPTLVALRVCGDTTVPMSLGLRMVRVQKEILSRLNDINELKNNIVKKFGEEKGKIKGQFRVDPGMDGWFEYTKNLADLMKIEVDLGEPFVLYQKGENFGWTEEVKTPIELTPNVMMDMGDLLDVQETDQDIKLVKDS